MATMTREPFERLQNLQQVVQNKCYLSEVGFVNGKYHFRGKYYSKQEIEALFPTTFHYSISRLDKNQIEP